MQVGAVRPLGGAAPRRTQAAWAYSSSLFARRICERQHNTTTQNFEGGEHRQPKACARNADAGDRLQEVEWLRSRAPLR